jgi:hypothetical protein
LRDAAAGLEPPHHHPSYVIMLRGTPWHVIG